MIYNLALLSPCSVCLVYAILLICRRKHNSKSQNILSLFLLLASISLLIFANYMAEISDYETYAILDTVDAFITPLIIPMMYLYFKSLTNEKPFHWKDYLWFVPAFIFGSCAFALYLMMGSENATNYHQYLLEGEPLPPQYTGTIYRFHKFITVSIYARLMITGTILISAYTVFTILRYHRRLKDFYSNLDDKSIKLDYAILFWYLMSCLIAMIFSFTGKPFWEKYPILTAIFFVLWAVIYFGLGYSGSQLKYSVEKLAQDLQQADHAERMDAACLSELAEESADEYVEKMEKFSSSEKFKKQLIAFNALMDIDKVYLKSDLRVDEVARLMYTNRKYVTLTIKESYQCSFSDYINRKRVEYSMQLMRANPYLRQQQLAEDSGFQSASTFNKSFRQVNGIPPKEWCKNHVLSKVGQIKQ